MAMKPLRERNPVWVGIVGLVILAIIALLAFNADNLPLIGGGTTYTAYFTEAAGLSPGNEVRVAGATVGKVTGVSLSGDLVRVTFRVRDVWVGNQSTVAIDIKTLLGAKYLAPNLAALATGGRLVVIGRQGGSRAEIDLGVLQGKRASVHATTLRARPPHQKAEVVAAVRQHVWPLIDAGQVGAVIDRTLPMSQAAQAHRVMAAGENIGKILLLRE